MKEQWRELKETIIELRDNEGTGTQQDVCKFLANLMNVLEGQMDEPKTGHWIKYGVPRCGEQHYQCTACGYYINFGRWGDLYTKEFKYCPNCGAEMSEIPTGSESEG